MSSPHSQLFYFNESLEFCEFIEWKIKNCEKKNFTAAFAHIYQGCQYQWAALYIYIIVVVTIIITIIVFCFSNVYE